MPASPGVHRAHELEGPVRAQDHQHEHRGRHREAQEVVDEHLRDPAHGARVGLEHRHQRRDVVEPGEVGHEARPGHRGRRRGPQARRERVGEHRRTLPVGAPARARQSSRRAGGGPDDRHDAEDEVDDQAPGGVLRAAGARAERGDDQDADHDADRRAGQQVRAQQAPRALGEQHRVDDRQGHGAHGADETEDQCLGAHGALTARPPAPARGAARRAARRRRPR